MINLMQCLRRILTVFLQAITVENTLFHLNMASSKCQKSREIFINEGVTQFCLQSLQLKSKETGTSFEPFFKICTQKNYSL